MSRKNLNCAEISLYLRTRRTKQIYFYKLQIIMQKKTFISEQGYQKPTLDLYTAPVENGFAQSLDGTGGIKDWENDGEGLEF